MSKKSSRCRSVSCGHVALACIPCTSCASAVRTSFGHRSEGRRSKRMGVAAERHAKSLFSITEGPFTRWRGDRDHIAGSRRVSRSETRGQF